MRDEPATTGYGAVPRVLAWVLAGLALATGLLEVLLPYEPRSLVLLELLPRAARVEATAKIAAVEDHPFCAVVGLSSVRDGIDRDRLAAARPDCPWIVLATGGGSFRQLRHLATPLLVHEPAPDVVVLGIHAAWLADFGPDQVADVRPTWIDQRGPVQMALWPWRNRNGMGLWIRHAADEARLRGLYAIGVPLSALVPPDPDPFAPQYDTGDIPASVGHRGDQLHNWRGRGWFLPELYRPDGPEAAALVEVLDTLRRKGTRVLVVSMPGSTAWRAEMPARAGQALREVLGEHIDPADVLDLEDAVDDAMMYDHSHVLAAGRRVVTDRIAAFVRDRAPMR